MDLEHGQLVMQTPGDTQTILSVAEGTDFLSFDLERRVDLQTNFPNTLNPSETRAIASIAMSKISIGFGRSSHREKEAARQAAGLIDTILDLSFRTNLKLDTTTDSQNDLVQQVLDAVQPPTGTVGL